jgi:pyruvate,orthophosphate dikinase
MMEFHHPFTNQELVVDLLRKIALDDTWFYMSLPEHEEALAVLVNIFRNLLYLPLPDQQQERAMQTFLEFAETLYTQKDAAPEMLKSVIAILQETLPLSRYVLVRFSGFMKGRIRKLSEDPSFGGIIIDLMRRSLAENLDFWEMSSDVEYWLDRNRPIFHSDMSGLVPLIGRSFFAEARKALQQAATLEELQHVMDFSAIANRFRGCLDEQESALDRIYYIFYLLNLPGMGHLKEHLLWDLNRMLRIVKNECSEQEMITFIERILVLSAEIDHMNTLLDCAHPCRMISRNAIIISHFIDKCRMDSSRTSWNKHGLAGLCR